MGLISRVSSRTYRDWRMDSDQLVYAGVICLGTILVLKMALNYFSRSERVKDDEPPLPAPLEKQDMNLSQLRKYNGVDKPNIVVAVNKKLFEVSKRSDIYGPDGMYGIGRSRRKSSSRNNATQRGTSTNRYIRQPRRSSAR